MIVKNPSGRHLSRCLSAVNLDGVDDVLPEDVAAGADAGEGIQIGGGEPDGKGGVLLAKGLACLLRMVEVMADEAAYGKLDNADQQTEQGDGREQKQRGLGVDENSMAAWQFYSNERSKQI